jgi:hypothetical protein
MLDTLAPELSDKSNLDRHSRATAEESACGDQ